MALDLIEMGRKACEEGVSVPEQIEAELAEVDAEIRGLEVSVDLYLREIDDLRRNVARCQDRKTAALAMRDELLALARELR